LAIELDPATREALVDRVRFYRDLGLTELYRRPVDAARLAQLAAALDPPRPADLQPADPQLNASPLPQLHHQETAANAGNPAAQQTPAAQAHLQEENPISPRKTMPAPPSIAAAVPLAGRSAALQIIRDEIGDCTRCALHTGRNKLVFGDGSAGARLMFVGEGPGADEDAQGLPFVGKAGQLLNNMINAMGLKREEVYIANVVKCRPPGNLSKQTPAPHSASARSTWCGPRCWWRWEPRRLRICWASGSPLPACVGAYTRSAAPSSS
jgi:DNA polymerase